MDSIREEKIKMGKRKNQALIDSDSSNDSTSDLDSVSIILRDLQIPNLKSTQSCALLLSLY